MTERLTLYFWPGSFYSQKVVMALIENNLTFNHEDVNLLTSQNLEPWFFKIRQDGKVPLLKDGEKLIQESEAIINYIDKQFTSGSRLVPEGNSDYDQIHNSLTQKNVPIEVITFGTLLNHDMSKTGLHPLFDKPFDVILATLNEGIDKAKLYATQHKDLKEAYDEKAVYLTKFRDNVLDRDNVQRCFDALQPVFDTVEAQLIKSTKQNPDSWLMNTDFSSADISLTILMNRLSFLGQTARYFTEDTRPHVFQYWQRVQQRKSFQDVMALFMNYTPKK